MTIGPQKPQPDPRGWLVFDHLPEDLQNAEDATQAADYDRGSLHREPYALPWFTRPATATERLLLAHLGYTDLPADLTTRVEYLTPGVRNRRWPALEQRGTQPQ